MKKTVYLFNCQGILDLQLVPNLYSTVKNITGNECNRYCCIFRNTENGKFWSKSSTVKHMEQNIPDYSAVAMSTVSKFVKLEMYCLPKGTKSWGLDETNCGFYVDCLNDDILHIYLVSSIELTSNQILSLWDVFSKTYTAHYMVSFSLDSIKHVEIYMYGRCIYPALADPKTYYSKTEKDVVDKLYDLNHNLTCDLGSCFSSCIVTKRVSIDEQAYNSKRIVGNNTVLFTKSS